ncbi:oxygenase MpaB family protein [Streptomyces sp. NPDC008150]|uniref:oxygenase MpaB family protein n=1 Tax=Streptomyces sp. NPDC008150 TaxID=3364816 RepID=UPI0036F05687
MTNSSLPGPGSLLRRTLGEWRIALVAWRLLVLQNADPAVAAGVGHFSTYRAHPWRRVEHTMDSGRRLFFSDRDGLRSEIARLERSHRRISGTDPEGRPFTAVDPGVRVWVLMTLYESMTAMRELSGDPLSAAELDELYAQFRAVCAEFGMPDELYPATAADVPAYMDRTIRERLECGEVVHDFLYGVLRQAPAPRRLGRLRPAWPLLRVAVARTLTALTLADLPPAFRERFGLRRTPSAAVLSWTLHRGTRLVMTRLPDRMRYRGSTKTPRSPRHASHAAAHGAHAAPRSEGASTAARSLPGQRGPRRGDDRARRVDAFFRQVLDQTGDGCITAVDLQSMAHNVCWQLELDDDRQSDVYTAFDTWWRHIRATMDADADGRVSRTEFVTAVLAGVDQDPAYLDKGLRVAVRALFRAADTDGSGRLGADEYRALFGGSRVHPAELNHGFRQLDGDGDGEISEEEFVAAFTDYFTARADTTAGTQLLGRP